MLSVLVVCTGNICRSPLAQALLEARSKDLLGVPLEVSSAGTWGHRGHPAMPETVRVGGELGLQVEGHTARPLEAQAVRAADLILGLAAEHRDRVTELVPEAVPKTFTLKELAALVGELPRAAPGGGREAALARIAQAHALRAGEDARPISDEDVSDPIGLGIESYRAVAWEIEGAVDELLAGMFGPPAAREAAGAGS